LDLLFNKQTNKKNKPVGLIFELKESFIIVVFAEQLAQINILM